MAKNARQRDMSAKFAGSKVVDVNGRPIPIMNRYKLKTEMNGIGSRTVWQQVATMDWPQNEVTTRKISTRLRITWGILTNLKTSTDRN